MAGISFSAPTVILDKVKYSSVNGAYNKYGVQTGFEITFELEELGLYENVKSTDIFVLQKKVEKVLLKWGKKYEDHINKKYSASAYESAAEKDDNAKKTINYISNMLSNCSRDRLDIDFNSFKKNSVFKIDPKIYIDNNDIKMMKFDEYGYPVSIELEKYPNEPSYDKVKNKYGLFSKIFFTNEIQRDYTSRVRQWKETVEVFKRDNDINIAKLDEYRKKWNSIKNNYDSGVIAYNDSIENLKSKYLIGDTSSIVSYCDLILSCQNYPEYVPNTYSLKYDNGTIVINYDYPSPDIVPDVESVRYVKSNRTIVEKKLSESAKKKLYNSLLYGLCLRTISVIFATDTIDSVNAVCFNGVVTSINKATGVEETKLILSVFVSKKEFTSIDLRNVDPKETFKFLKGVSAAELMGLTPIAPIMSIETDDARFIDSRAVNYDDSTNLAAMDWDDFEHLIREIFETEFSSSGEVKITQASRDGGVDAIAFDSDPIRGGKIVIQAKRYTNTVDVSAVRDLYGTVMNEGAIKGILVTTSNYGKDAYEFAKNKPLTLLNGANLLSLLEKHGRKAKINISEAKTLALNAKR